VGKTAAIADLVRTTTTHTWELISADSRQVYRGLDIGTAKPSSAERALLPHHLIDVCDPRESWDVGQFVERADALVDGIRRRGATPLISGGTAFYIRGYLFGLPGTPKASAELRARLDQRLADEGLDRLREELERVDPASAARIAPADAYRILRALEVYHTAGRPLSSYAPPETVRPGVRPLMVGLFRDRRDLYARIDRRVEEMFAAGLPAEVAALLEQGYGADDPGMQTIGYREFLELGPPPWSPATLGDVRDRIARNTRRYAKRQETFFRRLPGVRWVRAGETRDLHAALEPVLDMGR